ncbi:hypothetical protein [Thalassospira marina]|uniref:Uncharacterized protein n=1 Tax=Thalassospira marina TaxID=2048283 RepID=A0A2N3KIP7_9PROT|nr:hypothetical protein [Thalassospira marina]PKR50425.1 hypothetical protein COO20_21350 [Thalassospira marina]
MTPYYETEFGVGYAGNCFQALNVIGNARKVFQHLIDLNSKNAKPSHSDIIRTFSSIFDEFIQSHSGKSNIAIDFLIFGYCPQSPSIPWLYKLSHRPRKKLEVTKLQINNNEIHGIGDALNNGSLVNKLKTVRRSFRRKFLKLKFYNNFEKEVFFEKMKVAQNNVTEKYIRNHIKNNKNKTVGGDIEKMELYNTGQRSVVTLTIPTGSSKNNNIGELSDGLAYVPFSKNFS